MSINKGESMKIEEMTILEANNFLKDAEAIAKLLGRASPTIMPEILSQEHDHPYKIGQSYLIRTVTCHWVGRLIAVYSQEIVLEKASWVADTGRFHVALRDGWDSNAEIEPVFKGNVILGRGSFIDVSEWHYDLPEQVK